MKTFLAGFKLICIPQVPTTDLHSAQSNLGATACKHLGNLGSATSDRLFYACLVIWDDGLLEYRRQHSVTLIKRHPEDKEKLHEAFDKVWCPH